MVHTFFLLNILQMTTTSHPPTVIPAIMPLSRPHPTPRTQPPSPCHPLLAIASQSDFNFCTTPTIFGMQMTSLRRTASASAMSTTLLCALVAQCAGVPLLKGHPTVYGARYVKSLGGSTPEVNGIPQDPQWPLEWPS